MGHGNSIDMDGYGQSEVQIEPLLPQRLSDGSGRKSISLFLEQILLPLMAEET